MNQLDLDVQVLNKFFSKLAPEEIIRESLKKFGKKIAYICSFGTESAIILDMIAKINKNFPIFLINTNFLFPETIAYKEELIRKLKLTNCKDILPEKRLLSKEDPNDDLWVRNTDRCCELRKVMPLENKLKGMRAWISGRKSIHKGQREKLKVFEVLNHKVVVNPLVNITKKQVDNYFKQNALPEHPLLQKGYLSIGCIHCTFKPSNIDDPRSGRWKNDIKTECGIHLAKKGN